LKLIDQQISQLKTRLEEEGRKEISLLSTLETIRLKRNVLQNEISSLNLRQKMAARELADLTTKIKSTGARLQKKKRQLKNSGYPYKFGRSGLFEFFLKANNLEVFLRESKNLTFLAQYQGEAISSYLNSLKELEKLQDEVMTKRAEIDGLLKEAAAKQQNLIKEEANSRQVLAEI